MGRLKGIPTILSPDLLHTLASMGHGDLIVLADANFPTSSICRCGPKEIRADGHGIPSLLKAIMQLMPIDTYTTLGEDFSVAVMDLVHIDALEGMPTPPVWKEYQNIIEKAENREITFEKLERQDFYDVAKGAFAVVHTGETALYGNIILRMGVISEDESSDKNLEAPGPTDEKLVEWGPIPYEPGHREPVEGWRGESNQTEVTARPYRGGDRRGR